MKVRVSEQVEKKEEIATDLRELSKKESHLHIIYVRIHFAILDPWPNTKPYRKSTKWRSHDCDISPEYDGARERYVDLEYGSQKMAE